MESAAIPTKKTWKNLGVRFVSAIILVAICLAPFYFGRWLWAVLAVLFSGRMMYEWVRMSDPQATHLAYLLPYIGIAVSSAYAVQGLWVYAVITAFLCAAICSVERIKRGRSLWAGLGALYILIPCLAIIGLRGNEIGFNTWGFQTVIYIVLVVVAADVGAYFGGSYFRGPKLSPKLSPNKTWSGFFSGLLFAIIIGGLVTLTIDHSFLLGLLMAVPVVLLSVAGDLLESGLKRQLEVKDTGGLLPGHGGLLDRMDSLMLATVGFAMIIYVFPKSWPI